jgi:hypothetical protein
MFYRSGGPARLVPRVIQRMWSTEGGPPIVVTKLIFPKRGPPMSEPQGSSHRRVPQGGSRRMGPTKRPSRWSQKGFLDGSHKGSQMGFPKWVSPRGYPDGFSLSGFRQGFPQHLSQVFLLNLFPVIVPGRKVSSGIPQGIPTGGLPKTVP